MTFDRPVQPGTTQITVKDPSNNTVPGSTTLETAGSSVTFVPSSDLASGTRYTVSVDGATSLGGNAMTQAFTSQFTTSGADACPCSLMETTAQPTLPDADDSSAVTLGLRFKPSVDGFIRGVRYYRDSANTGTHVGKLFTAGGNELASVTIPTQGCRLAVGQLLQSCFGLRRHDLRHQLLRAERPLLRELWLLQQPCRQRAAQLGWYGRCLREREQFPG